MSGRSALEKRIKRHVVGRIREYFAATAPGLEPLCRQELQSLPLTVQESRACPGGVLFQGRLVDCFMANLYLRTANRVLMRIGTFKATHFQELEMKLSKLPWELFLDPGQAIDFRISAKKSKLYHTGAIADRFRSTITDRIPIPQQAHHEGDLRQNPQQIFVRVKNDRFTVSLDSSGVNLHKRWVKTIRSKAPLRETTAAAVLMLAACVLPPQHTRDYACADGYEFSVRFSGADDPGDVALFDDGSGAVKLPRAPAASGARYSNGAIAFWEKGDSAMILRGDEAVHIDCTR